MKKTTLLFSLFGLIVLFALSGCYGVYDLGDKIPDKTTFGAPFINTETAVATLNGDQVTIMVPFVNGMTKNVVVTGGSASGDCVGTTASASIASIPTNEHFVVEWVCTTSLSKKDQLKAELTFTYLTGTSIEYPFIGSTSVTLQ